MTAQIPALALLRISEDALRARAAAICSQLPRVPIKITIGQGRAKAGGGTLPKSILPSVTTDIVPENSSLAEFAANLRGSKPAVVGYVADKRFKLDLRTIFPQQDSLVVEAIRAACRK